MFKNQHYKVYLKDKENTISCFYQNNYIDEVAFDGITIEYIHQCLCPPQKHILPIKGLAYDMLYGLKVRLTFNLEHLTQFSGLYIFESNNEMYSMQSMLFSQQTKFKYEIKNKFQLNYELGNWPLDEEWITNEGGIHYLQYKDNNHVYYPSSHQYSEFMNNNMKQIQKIGRTKVNISILISSIFSICLLSILVLTKNYFMRGGAELLYPLVLIFLGHIFIININVIFISYYRYFFSRKQLYFKLLSYIVINYLVNTVLFIILFNKLIILLLLMALVQNIIHLFVIHVMFWYEKFINIGDETYTKEFFGKKRKTYTLLNRISYIFFPIISFLLVILLNLYGVN